VAGPSARHQRATSVVVRKHVSKDRISNRNWLGNRSCRKQAIKPSLTETRIAFLPGSASQAECDVTHSKQTTARFLPGATTACFQPLKRASNRKLPMRPASASRSSAPRRTRRGTRSAFSNRELSTILNSAFRQLQTAPTDPPPVERSLNVKRSLNAKITDGAQRPTAAANFPRALAHGSSGGQSLPADRQALAPIKVAAPSAYLSR